MTSSIRKTVVQCIQEIAPEVSAEELNDDTDLRDELDLDSMDLLRLAQALHGKLGIEIPESDYGQLTTVADYVAYLGKRSENHS